MIPVVHELITTCVSLPFAAQQVVYSQWLRSFGFFVEGGGFLYNFACWSPKCCYESGVRKVADLNTKTLSYYHHLKWMLLTAEWKINTLSKHGTLSSEYDSISLLSRGPMSEPSHCLKCRAICGNVLSSWSDAQLSRFRTFSLGHLQ